MVLQAGIASLHCAAATYEQTDWAKIVELYDELYRVSPSPIVALNRAVALGNAREPEEGLCALRKIVGAEQLLEYPFCPAAQGELLLLTGRPEEARAYFEKAEKLARSRSETEFFGRKRSSCQPDLPKSMFQDDEKHERLFA
jgi:RNA polymerase sigma-70 factor (ECF subfamily)